MSACDFLERVEFSVRDTDFFWSKLGQCKQAEKKSEVKHENMILNCLGIRNARGEKRKRNKENTHISTSCIIDMIRF